MDEKKSLLLKAKQGNHRHHLTDFFKGKLTQLQIAIALDKPYSSVCRILEGYIKPDEQTEKKLQQLAAELTA